MRIDAYVQRIADMNKSENADPKKLARMIELTLEKVSDVVSETEQGKEAIKLIQNRLIRHAVVSNDIQNIDFRGRVKKADKDKVSLI